jgi:hypothetical protein
MKDSSTSSPYTAEHEQYRKNLANDLKKEWKKGFTEKELNTLSLEQQERVKSSSTVTQKKKDILADAQQTDEYKNAHSAKVGVRKASKNALVENLMNK